MTDSDRSMASQCLTCWKEPMYLSDTVASDPGVEQITLTTCQPPLLSLLSSALLLSSPLLSSPSSPPTFQYAQRSAWNRAVENPRRTPGKLRATDQTRFVIAVKHRNDTFSSSQPDKDRQQSFLQEYLEEVGSSPTSPALSTDHLGEEAASGSLCYCERQDSGGNNFRTVLTASSNGAQRQVPQQHS